MPNQDIRSLDLKNIQSDLVVVGGGLAGVCCAITSAREGLSVVLIQDRPVLGGNASSEVRLWALGATSHMGNNNRWSREGGVIDEIFVENLYRNSEGNPVLFDALLLDKVTQESRITLLLNTAVYDVEKKDSETISGVNAFCSQNETFYHVQAPLFCDASGDGIVGFRAGAAFRMGAESKEEFGEGFAPDKEYGELLGHTIFFYSKDTGKKVTFVPPKFALDDIAQIPRFGQIAAVDQGCSFWWLEFGGRFDTIHETEKIKWELWKIVYGVWNYIKNSGKFPEAENLTLEWVGTVPGKRESRRFEGDYIMTQQDVVKQRRHDDAVAYGGWAIDLHPADGVYSTKSGCTQWHSKGVYQIPYRSLYSRNIDNLFLAGRVISVSHVAFGSTRVMATTAHTAQAVGMAAAICIEQKLNPRALLEPQKMNELQTRLLRSGHFIPEVNPPEASNLIELAEVTASSTLALSQLIASEKRIELDAPRAMLVPITKGRVPRVTWFADIEVATEIEFQLRGSLRSGNFTPEVNYSKKTISVLPGKNVLIEVDFEVTLSCSQYLFVCVMPVKGVSFHLSDQRVTGVLSLQHGSNRKVSKSAVQSPPEEIGVDTFEFWIPERRPGGENFAISFNPPLELFSSQNVLTGPDRPTIQSNAWAADLNDPSPKLFFSWKYPQSISRVELMFDTDFDHAMESVQWGHPERTMPFCVKHFRILDGRGELLAEVKENYQTRSVVVFENPVQTSEIILECFETNSSCPASLFRVRCYEK